jgi:hypothetical protein
MSVIEMCLAVVLNSYFSNGKLSSLIFPPGIYINRKAVKSVAFPVGMNKQLYLQLQNYNPYKNLCVSLFLSVLFFSGKTQ